MANKKINKNSLEFPREARRSLKPSYDPEVFGRWSERFARFLGTARFLVDRIQGNKDRERDERNMADTEYLTRELASLRSALSEVTTKDYLHKEMTDAIEEIVKKLNKQA